MLLGAEQSERKQKRFFALFRLTKCQHALVESALDASVRPGGQSVSVAMATAGVPHLRVVPNSGVKR